jgi:hypothetical protein
LKLIDIDYDKYIIRLLNVKSNQKIEIVGMEAEETIDKHYI